MITYPRTDSRYLPEDYMANVKQIVTELSESSSDLADWAKDALKNDRLKFQKRIFNNAKVSDHFAIIPTGRVVKIDEPAAKLYDMIVKRFLAVFFPHAEFEVTKRLTTIDHGSEKDTFRTDGKILIIPGWLSVYGRKPGVGAGKDELCMVQDGEDARAVAIEMLEKETNPPARFTESTLLSAMEGAGKLVDDDALREAMSERGLGTPATRAATIEGLIRQKYITRDGRELIATGKGVRLIDLLQEMDVKPLTSPEMTGDWEAKLHQMEKGELARDAFMNEIKKFTESVVQKARGHYEEIISRPFDDLKCPAQTVMLPSSSKPTPPTSAANRIVDSEFQNTSPDASLQKKRPPLFLLRNSSNNVRVSFPVSTVRLKLLSNSNKQSQKPVRKENGKPASSSTPI
jgi:DNA topoisomerase-3